MADHPYPTLYSAPTLVGLGESPRSGKTFGHFGTRFPLLKRYSRSGQVQVDSVGVGVPFKTIKMLIRCFFF